MGILRGGGATTPSVGELGSDCEPSTPIIMCHSATDYELLSFQSGEGSFFGAVIYEKQQHMFNKFV